MCAVPWLAEQLKFVLHDICLCVKQCMFQLYYINCNCNINLQTANGKLRCRPSCAVLRCWQREKFTVMSYTSTKHEMSQKCYKHRNDKMKRLQCWTAPSAFSAVHYLSKVTCILFKTAFGRNKELRIWREVCIWMEYCTECWVVTTRSEV